MQVFRHALPVGQEHDRKAIADQAVEYGREPGRLVHLGDHRAEDRVVAGVCVLLLRGLGDAGFRAAHSLGGRLDRALSVFQAALGHAGGVLRA